MKNRTRLFGVYLPIFLSVMLGTAAMRTVACLLDFDFKTNYFNNKVLISIADYTVLVAAIFFLTYMYTARKDIKLIPDFTSAATFIPTGLVAVSLPFISRFIFSKASEVTKSLSNSFLSSAEIRSLRLQQILLYILAIFAILSIVHFVLTALVEKRSSLDRAGFGICTVVFLALYAAFLYFDTDLPLNAPNKIVDQMAYLFSALFFLYETRLSLGREKWQHYISFGFVAALLTAYSSIPTLIVYAAEGKILSNSIYETVLTFSLFLFITARCLLTGELIEDTNSETVSALIKLAEEREALITPKSEEEPQDEAESDDNQITIEDLVPLSDTAYSDDSEQSTDITDESREKNEAMPKENELSSEHTEIKQQDYDEQSTNTTEPV